ncbi:MAG: hypothetical protein KTV68_18000 [Acidimicrobiia bacterium]|nr:hypothetical protein [Acidimicrobiia bacterium]MCY4433905.1 hypothetical protein [bacterium]
MAARRRRSPDLLSADGSWRTYREYQEVLTGHGIGLIYCPGRNTSTAALTRIVGAVTDYLGMHSTHMRDESDGLLGAIAEVASIS